MEAFFGLEASVSEGEKSGERGEQEAPKKGMNHRFRAPVSSTVDGPAYVPDDDDDDAVNEVAKRFRSGPRLGGAVVSEAESLDAQMGEDDDDDDGPDAGSLLAALDSSPEDVGAGDTAAKLTKLGEISSASAQTDRVEEPPSMADTQRESVETIPTVNIEPIDENEESAEERPVVCPSCHAENPAGMSFCVQCGGSLEGGGRSESAGEGGLGKADSMVERDPPPPSEAAQKQNPWDVELVSINEDGSDGKAVSLKYLETTVGRDGDSRFPTDAFLSPKHARFHIEEGELYIEDLYSLNGTFIKLREETRLTPGDTILMGRQVLRFERFEQSITPKTKSSDGTRYMGSPAPGGSFKVLQIGIGGVVQNVYCLPDSGAVLGREKGDIVFPHDKFMSGRHAQIYTGDDGQCYLVDLNSSNGTWIKIWEKTKLKGGDYLFMGQQLFRVEIE